MKSNTALKKTNYSESKLSMRAALIDENEMLIAETQIALKTAIFSLQMKDRRVDWFNTCARVRMTGLKNTKIIEW